MATYTIHINERTKEGCGLVTYLRSIGLISSSPADNGIEATRRAFRELKEGKVTRCKNFDDYKKKSWLMREIVYTHQYKHDVKRARYRHLPEKTLSLPIM